MKSKLIIFVFVGFTVLTVIISSIVTTNRSAEDSEASRFKNLAGANTKFAVPFFYWHWCGDNNSTDASKQNWRNGICVRDSKSIQYQVKGFTERDSSFGFYGERSYEWVISQFKDMETALIDYVIVDTWKVGAVNDTEPPNLAAIVPHIQKAIREKKTKLKFGMMIESGAIKELYNKKIGNQNTSEKIDIKTKEEADRVVSVINEMIFYFYDNVPRNSWAVDRFGRPYTFFFDYQLDVFSERSKSDYLANILYQINTKFQNRYKSELASIVNWEWLYHNIDYSKIYANHMKEQTWQLYGSNYDKTISGNAAGAFSWSTYGFPQSIGLNSLHIGNVSPGFNKCNWLSISDPLNQGPDKCYQLSNTNKVFPRKEGQFLEDNFLRLNSLVGSPYDLIMFETWGELWEGTTLQRAQNYPKYNAIAKQDYINECNNVYKDPSKRNTYCLAEDFYIQKVRSLIQTYGPRGNR